MLLQHLANRHDIFKEYEATATDIKTRRLAGVFPAEAAMPPKDTRGLRCGSQGRLYYQLLLFITRSTYQSVESNITIRDDENSYSTLSLANAPSYSQVIDSKLGTCKKSLSGGYQTEEYKEKKDEGNTPLVQAPASVGYIYDIFTKYKATFGKNCEAQLRTATQLSATSSNSPRMK